MRFLPALLPLLFLLAPSTRARGQSSDTLRLAVRSDTICLEGAELTAREVGVAYHWSTGDTTRTIPIFLDGPYTVTIVQGDGRVVIDPREVTLQRVPNPVLPVPDLPPPYCEGQQITFSVSLTGYDRIEWNDARGNVTPGFGPDNRFATFTFRVGGGVSYIAYYEACREQLTVLPPLPFSASDLGASFKADLIPDRDSICTGDTVTVRVSGTQIDRIEWEDGRTDSVRTIVASTATSPTVTVTSVCSDTLVELSIDDRVSDCRGAGPCEVVLPQLITPNGDGRNDEFRPFTNCRLERYTLLIFNRWGQAVAELSPEQPAWDGLVDGTPQEADLYLYKLVYEVRDADAIPQTMNGTFYLVR